MPGKTGNAAYPLIDPVHWLLNVRPFATRAAAGASEALPVLKNISTHKTTGR